MINYSDPNLVECIAHARTAQQLYYSSHIDEPTFKLKVGASWQRYDRLLHITDIVDVIGNKIVSLLKDNPFAREKLYQAIIHNVEIGELDEYGDVPIVESFIERYQAVANRHITSIELVNQQLALVSSTIIEFFDRLVQGIHLDLTTVLIETTCESGHLFVEVGDKVLCNKCLLEKNKELFCGYDMEDNICNNKAEWVISAEGTGAIPTCDFHIVSFLRESTGKLSPAAVVISKAHIDPSSDFLGV